MIKARLDRRNLYFDAFLRLKAKSASPKMVLAEPDVAYAGLTKFISKGQALEIGDYLLLYDFGTVWYSSKVHLIEELTIRFQREYNNPVTDVVNALETIARHIGARGIAVGDTQAGLMLPYYQAAGYSFLGTQLFKEVHYGVCEKDHGGASPD
jgi:hypothetical protein